MEDIEFESADDLVVRGQTSNARDSTATELGRHAVGGTPAHAQRSQTVSQAAPPSGIVLTGAVAGPGAADVHPLEHAMSDGSQVYDDAEEALKDQVVVVLLESGFPRELVLQERRMSKNSAQLYSKFMEATNQKRSRTQTARSTIPDESPQRGKRKGTQRKRAAKKPPAATAPATAGAVVTAPLIDPATLPLPPLIPPGADWEVECLLDHRVDEQGLITEYQIKWKFFEDPKDYTWEPVENLIDCQEAVVEYHRQEAERKRAAAQIQAASAPGRPAASRPPPALHATVSATGTEDDDGKRRSDRRRRNSNRYRASQYDMGDDDNSGSDEQFDETPPEAAVTVQLSQVHETQTVPARTQARPPAVSPPRSPTVPPAGSDYTYQTTHSNSAPPLPQTPPTAKARRASIFSADDDEQDDTVAALMRGNYSTPATRVVEPPSLRPAPQSFSGVSKAQSKAQPKAQPRQQQQPLVELPRQLPPKERVVPPRPSIQLQTRTPSPTPPPDVTTTSTHVPAVPARNEPRFRPALTRKEPAPPAPVLRPAMSSVHPITATAAPPRKRSPEPVPSSFLRLPAARPSPPRGVPPPMQAEARAVPRIPSPVPAARIVSPEVAPPTSLKRSASAASDGDNDSPPRKRPVPADNRSGTRSPPDSPRFGRVTQPVREPMPQPASAGVSDDAMLDNPSVPQTSSSTQPPFSPHVNFASPLRPSQAEELASAPSSEATEVMPPRSPLYGRPTQPASRQDASLSPSQRVVSEVLSPLLAPASYAAAAAVSPSVVRSPSQAVSRYSTASSMVLDSQPQDYLSQPPNILSQWPGAGYLPSRPVPTQEPWHDSVI